MGAGRAGFRPGQRGGIRGQPEHDRGQRQDNPGQHKKRQMANTRGLGDRPGAGRPAIRAAGPHSVRSGVSLTSTPACSNAPRILIGSVKRRPARASVRSARRASTQGATRSRGSRRPAAANSPSRTTMRRRAALARSSSSDSNVSADQAWRTASSSRTASVAAGPSRRPRRRRTPPRCERLPRSAKVAPRFPRWAIPHFPRAWAA